MTNARAGTHKRKLLAAVLLACLFSPDAHAQQTPTREEFTSDFDLMWTTLRDDYAYFGRKQTDWDRVCARCTARRWPT